MQRWTKRQRNGFGHLISNYYEAGQRITFAIHPAEVFAVIFACTGEEHSSCRHVDSHGKCFCSKQGLKNDREKDVENVEDDENFGIDTSEVS